VDNVRSQVEDLAAMIERDTGSVSRSVPDGFRERVVLHEDVCHLAGSKHHEKQYREAYNRLDEGNALLATWLPAVGSHESPESVSWYSWIMNGPSALFGSGPGVPPDTQSVTNGPKIFLSGPPRIGCKRKKQAKPLTSSVDCPASSPLQSATGKAITRRP